MEYIKEVFRAENCVTYRITRGSDESVVEEMALFGSDLGFFRSFCGYEKMIARLFVLAHTRCNEAILTLEKHEIIKGAY